MSTLGIIGGSGLTQLPELQVTRREVGRTPFGEPSAPLVFGEYGGRSVVFLPRHGAGHRLPPHRINYRANIWALKSLGVENVIGMAAVGGITRPPLSICVPDQIIDYTFGRDHTFFDGEDGNVTHIDFTRPFCESLRGKIIAAAQAAGLDPATRGTYGVCQGPRLETAAEIGRLENDGCDLVGMTAMPEAGLAREAGLCYATCSLVVNWAAGKSAGPISMDEIESNLATGMASASAILARLEL
ncbi:MAG: S-methyl-5'-thioinosine phosphorylase [Pseudomonadota bacterium]